MMFSLEINTTKINPILVLMFLSLFLHLPCPYLHVIYIGGSKNNLKVFPFSVFFYVSILHILILNMTTAKFICRIWNAVTLMFCY